MDKHAYLIIANRNFEQLSELIKALDYPGNDIYLLIDSTSSEKRITISTVFSKLYVLPEIPIYWGDYSQIEAELKLFYESSQRNYSYYHLLSGLDLPLVSQDIIHEFFDKHPEKQFVSYSAMGNQEDLRCRLQKHLLTKYFRLKKANPFFYPLKEFRHLENAYLKLIQDNDFKQIKFGSNWVSISNEFIQKIVSKSNMIDIKRKFNKGFLVDELLIPYELEKLGFEDSVYDKSPVHDREDEFQGNFRFINWWDGSPYTWRLKDFERLSVAKERGYFFARKFDDKIDSKIIKKILANL